MTNKAYQRVAAALGVLLLGGAALAIYLNQDAAPLGGKVARLIAGPEPTAPGWPVAMSTLAGDGISGFADGAAAQARFADPFGLAQDRAGNVYVADAGDNNRIRKITPEGVVSTLAGAVEGFADGSGELAAFHTPSAIAIDPDGNLIVADTGNHAIRKITPAGVVTTVAGSGAPGHADGLGKLAMFDGPVGVAVDKAGIIYVADTYNDRIRKITPDGMVTTIAGGGAPDFGDGPALSGAFDTPSGIAVDGEGVLYIADTGNAAIRRLGKDGMLSTIAQPAETEQKPLLQRPAAVAITADGWLYVSEMRRGRILQISPAGVMHGLTGIGIDIEVGDEKALRLVRPAGMVLSRDGSLLVADAAGRVVRKLSKRGDGPAPVAATVLMPSPPAPKPGSFPWPFAPQYGKHEVVGIVGEVRGSYDGEARDHFHNGLDIQANMGEKVLAVAAEKVSSPLPNGAFNNVGEGLGVDSFAYIHTRVGRTAKHVSLDPKRFVLLADSKGKPNRVRVRRGTRFAVGDALGTVNQMFHVHLIQRTPGGEANPLALPFPGLADAVVPSIDSITLADQSGKTLQAKPGKRLLVARAGGPLVIVVDAYDQTDGNAARRKLGLYKVGYQVLGADGVALPGFEQPKMNIEFNRLPPDDESVKVAYAEKSGITVYGNKTTRFLYVVTNTVRDGAARTGFWDPAPLAPGDYTIRIHAADFAGNVAEARRDLAITVQ